MVAVDALRMAAGKPQISIDMFRLDDQSTLNRGASWSSEWKSVRSGLFRHAPFLRYMFLLGIDIEYALRKN